MGGILSVLVSLYALKIAVRADTEHISWLKVVTRESSSGTPSAFEIVNGSKKTVGIVKEIIDETGDHNSALAEFVGLPIEVAPGASFPLAVARTLANSYPTIVELNWQERSVDSQRLKGKLRSVRLYL
jgi:hypothetical protein